MSRLSLATLDSLPHAPSWQPPVLDPRALRVGIVHLGVGAFHRAHQAVYTEDAAADAGLDQWGIAGVTQRSAAVRDQLGPQDGLYGVLERGAQQTRLQVVASIREVLAGSQTGDAVVDRIADPDVRLVTLTVTEKGYRMRADGRLDLADPAVTSDLQGGPPGTAVGQLARGLQRRYEASGAPVTVLCCDNLVANGRMLHRLVHGFFAALSDKATAGLLDWMDGAVRFPSSMVDRIVPATTDEDRAHARALLGVADEGLVVAEPFRQWVLEDAFAAERPPWERVGAVLTDDVAPWEMVKLRVLNAAHSMLAYLGALRGHDTVADAVADDALAAAVEALLVEDVTPTLRVPDGLDLAGYRDEVMRRFANPALRHRTVQVAMDGSQKLPVRLLGTVRDRLAADAVPRWAALAVAGWMVYVAAGHDCNGRRLPLEDPMADRLNAAAATAYDPGGLVDALLRVDEVFGADLGGHRDFRAALVEHVAGLGQVDGASGWVASRKPSW